MKLSEYFESNKGTAVLATSNSDGQVNNAIYSRPHFLGEGTISLIMNDRLSHDNLQTNKNACFMFIEAGEHYSGVRLYLKMVEETDDTDTIQKHCRRCSSESGKDDGKKKFFVTFSVERTRTLIGADDLSFSL